MKRFLAISLATLMVFSIVGCSKKKDDSLVDADGGAGVVDIVASTVTYEGYEFSFAVNEDGEYEITSVNYNGSKAIDIKIPSQVDGRPISGIANDAFKANSFIKSIVIPDSVEYIGDFAFYGCTGLTSITLPNSVTHIGAGAFWDCASLKNVTLSKELKSIDNYAFMNCTALESITFPAKLETIGEGAFFSCREITSVTIPASVKTVGKAAFIYCEELKSATIEGKNTVLAEEGVFVACHESLVVTKK